MYNNYCNMEKNCNINLNLVPWYFAFLSYSKAPVPFTNIIINNDIDQHWFWTSIFVSYHLSRYMVSFKSVSECIDPTQKWQMHGMTWVPIHGSEVWWPDQQFTVVTVFTTSVLPDTIRMTAFAFSFFSIFSNIDHNKCSLTPWWCSKQRWYLKVESLINSCKIVLGMMAAVLLYVYRNVCFNENQRYTFPHT